MTKIQHYQKLLEMLNDLLAKGILKESIDNRYAVEAVILTEELKEKFKMELTTVFGDYLKVDEYSDLALWGAKHCRTISWSDDDSQPEDEWLYRISFPCGAYSFHNDYPTQSFNTFFVELKKLNPKYIDSANHALYFTHENASEARVQYKILFNHYKAQVQKELDARRVEELKKELSKLEEGHG